MITETEKEYLFDKINRDGYVVLTDLITERQCNNYKDILNKSYPSLVRIMRAIIIKKVMVSIISSTKKPYIMFIIKI